MVIYCLIVDRYPTVALYLMVDPYPIVVLCLMVDPCLIVDLSRDSLYPPMALCRMEESLQKEVALLLHM